MYSANILPRHSDESSREVENIKRMPADNLEKTDGFYKTAQNKETYSLIARNRRDRAGFLVRTANGL